MLQKSVCFLWSAGTGERSSWLPIKLPILFLFSFFIVSSEIPIMNNYSRTIISDRNLIRRADRESLHLHEDLQTHSDLNQMIGQLAKFQN